MSDWSEFWGTVLLLGMFALACGSLYAIDWLKKLERRDTSARLESEEKEGE